MNKNAIQRFAVWARTELISQVSQRAYQYDITADGYGDYDAEAVGGRLLSDDEKKQRQQLISQIRSKGYTQVMEEIAYTWFNRFIALRFMEVNNYLPTHIRVFSDASGAFKPEILSNALHLDLDGLDMEKVSDLIERNQSEDLYRYLLLTQCNALSAPLPRMFESMGSYTELLLPNNILRQEGVLGHMVTDIPEEDWTDQVQIIGWLYQYYISEKHEQVVDPIYGSTIKKEDIPAATQLFTTDWVVRYMVDNSLGRYWVEHHPESKLKDKLKFLVSPKSGIEKFLDERIAPQELSFYDPCMGSGHILVYAFDVLMEIYKECGYGEREAAGEIIKNNLYGLDIDERCSQLAYFAIMMKARSYDRRFFSRNITPNVLSVCESNEIASFTHFKFMPDESMNRIGENLVSTFRHAKEIGTLLRVEPDEYTEFTRYLDLCADKANIDLEFSYWNEYEKPLLKHLAEQATIMSRKFTVVCTNPPYMNKMGGKLKEFAISDYKPYSSDLFSMFIVRNFDYCISNGYVAFMTPNVWMFIRAYQNLREFIIQQKSIVSLVQMAKGAFFKEATVDICSFIMRNSQSNKPAVFYRLEQFKGDMDVQEKGLLSGIANDNCAFCYETYSDIFEKLPGNPIAYWASTNLIKAFQEFLPISKIGEAKAGMTTGDNNRFLRFWTEVDFRKIGIGFNSALSARNSMKKWFPYNKGGGFRRWYGLNDYVVLWENDGFEIKNATEKGRKIASVRSERLYFKEAITWATLTSGLFSARYSEEGHLFDDKGSSAFIEHKDIYFVLALLNTKISEFILGMLNPTISFQSGNIGAIPVPQDVESSKDVTEMAKECVDICKEDWDLYETSWDFEMHPIVKKALSRFHWGHEGAITLEYVYKYVAQDFEERFDRLKANEEELNHIFIDIYGLQDELTPEVEEKDVSVRRADLGRDIRSMISYAVGCMFGRYSLVQWGLAYAGGEWNPGDRGFADYGEFEPDKDNIIPICDDEYFDDDITGRFIKWVEVVFGKETLEENLKYIADALVGKGTPREVIRSYFLNDFYADHLKTYQKRPIYWLFDSGKKNGFKALIYMHRYQSDLLARMRTDYVHEQQERYRTQLKHIGDAMDSASASERLKLAKQQKKLQEQALELQKYEEKVHHLADQNIKIDLDDGVVHNYELFADVLAKRK